MIRTSRSYRTRQDRQSSPGIPGSSQAAIALCIAFKFDHDEPLAESRFTCAFTGSTCSRNRPPCASMAGPGQNFRVFCQGRFVGHGTVTGDPVSFAISLISLLINAHCRWAPLQLTATGVRAEHVSPWRFVQPCSHYVAAPALLGAAGWSDLDGMDEIENNPR